MEKRIIVNGTFDILHRGHIELLRYAHQLGNHLLVCIDSDQRVKELKGIERPVNSQEDRQFMLRSLRWVDDCWIFDSAEELESIIENYRPDIMVKGSDYKDKSIVGSQYCKEIRFYDHTGHSTTKIIQRIVDR